MRKPRDHDLLRREFIRGAGFAAAAACWGPFFLFAQRAEAGRRKLRVLRWRHPVPGYDRWFERVFAEEWGHKHDTKVIVDHAPPEKIRSQAVELSARKGHDLVMFPSPPAALENDVIDHREIYRELRRHWGEPIELAHRSTFNPQSKKYFAFCDSYIPAPFNWLKDLWTEAGLPFGPVDYDTLRSAGREIRQSRGIPCGLGLGGDLSSTIGLYSILWSFGGAVQDEQGKVAIRSPRTIEALKYVKALYQEAETPEVLNWKSFSNERGLLAGKISCAINAISISRAAEKKTLAPAGAIMISPALRAHSDPVAPPYITNCHAIWSFAENKDGAKQFLMDLVGSSAQAFQASEFCNFPSFPKTVPDFLHQLSDDPRAVPQGKYSVLRDTLFWTKPIGYPGYTSAAVDEVLQNFVIPRMFAQVAKGELTPEDAATAAAKEIEPIFSKSHQS